MASDESPSPGSPRKKLKTEWTTSMDTEMESVGPAPETINNANHAAVHGEHISSAQNPIEPDIAPHTSHLDSTPQAPTSTHQVEMAATTSDPESTQLEKERASGITELVRPDLLGFTGILKKRYTDFMVNEILPSGEVVHLTNLKAPKKAQQKEDNKIEKVPSKPTDAAPIDQTESSQKAPEKQVEPLVKEDDVSVVENMPQDTTIEKGQEDAPKKESVNAPESPVAPHLASQTGSTNSARSSPKASPAKGKRTRQQFIIRHTENGWAEFDKPKKENEKIEKPKAPKSNLEALEEAFASNTPETENIPQKAEAPNSESASQPQTNQISEASPAIASAPEAENILQKPEAPDPIPASQPQTNHTPETTSASQWQAFTNPNGEPSTASKISEEDKTVLLSYFSETVVDAIRSLYSRVLNSSRRSTRDYGTVKSDVIDRPLRTKIHQDIRRIFQSRLETATDRDGAMIVSAMPPSSNSYNSGPRPDRNERGQGGGRRDQNGSRGQTRGFGKPKWEELGGEYLHFTLYKENKDTMECISWLSKSLRLGPKAFEFAGTKDRRAITAQRVSVYRQTIGQVVDAGKTLRNANTGDYEYRPRALQLGELTGNEFTITLRDCKFSDLNLSGTNTDQAHAIVSEALKNLVDRGFINYYGLQRFGTFSTSTSDVGVKMLQGDFKSAVDAILDYTPASLAASQDAASKDDGISRDDKARAHAIHTFEMTGKAQKALDHLPRKFSAESAIIRHLGSRPSQQKDYVGAMMTISRNLRLMYVHAYQSLVWNMATSKRWSTYGDTTVEGDLVLVSEHVDKESQPEPQEVDEDGEPIIQPAAEDRATNIEELFTRARILSKEEAESGKYSIFDIVLPTPGFDILYPANEIGKFYEEFMASPAGGGLNPHDMRRPQRDFSLSGSYRKILARPGKNASFEIKTYENDDEQFVETDMERLNRTRGKSHPSHSENAKGNAVIATAAISGEKTAAENGEQKNEVGDIANPAEETILSPESEDNSDLGGGVALNKDNEKIAVILKLQLGSSQYATMALRELMKADGVKTYKPDFGGGR